MNSLPAQRIVPSPSFRQRGVTSIEYALLGALVALGMAVGATAFGDGLGDFFVALGVAFNEIISAVL